MPVTELPAPFRAKKTPQSGPGRLFDFYLASQAAYDRAAAAAAEQASPVPPPPPEHDPPPYHGRREPFVDSMVWDDSLPQLVLLHEAAHCVVGIHLGLSVESMAVDPDGRGGFVATRWNTRSPSDTAFLAVATAAGPALNEKAGASVAGCRNDIAQVAKLKADYAAMTGKPLPAWGMARELLRLPEVTTPMVALARALRPGIGLTRPEIDAILGRTAQPAEYADHGGGI